MSQNYSAVPTSRPAPTSRWRRSSVWVVVLLLVALCVWLVVSLAQVGLHAKRAAAALSTMTTQITAGDTTGAAQSIEVARSNTEAARNSIESVPVSILRVVPYFRTNLDGADSFMGAALEVLDAAEAANDVYPVLSGVNGSTGAVFEDGKVNIPAITEAEPAIGQASQGLTNAMEYLGDVPPDVSPFLRRYVDEASSQVAALQKGMRVAEMIVPQLPKVLGEGTPATYLVVFNNPAELYAGGGAVLNIAVVQFDDGRMKVVDRGDVAHFFPLVQRVPWNPVAQGPYYAKTGAADGFAWSNLHQDFRISGEDIMRSWVANGGQPVDGVVSLDPVALQAAVAVTGPIQTKYYGRITSDNLVRKLFIDGYNDDPAAQERRHRVNDRLIDTMLTRMLQGDTSLTVARAIHATAPGQHIRIHLSDNRLAAALHEADVDGAQPAPEPDRIAFYTQNQNSSKVDVFQTRTVTHDVHLQEDGSATVVQKAKVTNNAPRTRLAVAERTGYSTGWAFHWNIVLLPENAQDVKISANPGDIKKDRRTFVDVDGRHAVRVGRWIPPGGTSRIITTYRLPAGTFGTDGNLVYRAGVEHQLTVNDVQMRINVIGPSQPTPIEGAWTTTGNHASTRFAVTGPTTVAVGFGDH